MDVSMEEYKKWAETVQRVLQEKTDWVKVYGDYAAAMLSNGAKMEQCRKKFRVPSPLTCYVTLGNSKDGKAVYDLRYLGQSVGEIKIQNEQPMLFVDEEKNETSHKYFGYEVGCICGEPWGTGKNSRKFRDFYRNVIDNQKLPRQKEHMVEARLFQELSKTTGEDKQLKYIQPIKFANCFTHMKTALAASGAKDGNFSVVKSGGEIDVFCRRKVGVSESRLTVIEVKDKPEKNESFKEAMFQAITYAVFIRELIHTPHGSKWMKIWGINDKKKDGITINAVVAIPISDEEIPDFHGQKIVLGNDAIALHYMALTKNVLDADGAVYFKTSL